MPSMVLWLVGQLSMLFLYYYAVVNNALNDKGRLYCGFIDLKKTFTDYFECVVGLKQGKVLSPVLFSLLLEDLELFLQDDPLCGLSIDGILLIIVLFAETWYFLAILLVIYNTYVIC